MPQPSKEPCKKQACDIQACLTKNNFLPQKCVFWFYIRTFSFFQYSLPSVWLPEKFQARKEIDLRNLIFVVVLFIGFLGNERLTRWSEQLFHLRIRGDLFSLALKFQRFCCLYGFLLFFLQQSSRYLLQESVSPSDSQGLCCSSFINCSCFVLYLCVFNFY